MNVYSEVIEFNGETTAASDHFILTTDDEWAEDGWACTSSEKIKINSNSNNITITAIDAVVDWYGMFYGDVTYSSGVKTETSEVENGSVVHVTNINSDKLEIGTVANYVLLKDITVYYTVDGDFIHHFTDAAKDNEDGTHSYKCADCGDYGATVHHAFIDFVCEYCGAVDTTGILTEAKTGAIAEINNAKTEASATIAEKAIADIDAASTVAAVNTIKTKALSDMAKADEDAAAAKALADAKKAAIAEVKANLTSDSTTAEKTLVDEAVTAINNATSIKAVENAKSDFNSKWKALHTHEDPTNPDEPSNTCNHMCHKGGFMGFIWKIVRFFSKLFGTNKTCSCGVAHY